MKNLLKNKTADSEGTYILFMIPIILISFLMLNSTNNKAQNQPTTETITATIKDININYGNTDSTTITFTNNQTINYNDRIPNILINKTYTITYLHYESGTNKITNIISIQEQP